MTELVRRAIRFTNRIFSDREFLSRAWLAGGPQPIHCSMPIRDVSVPKNPDHLADILDTIDAALAEGHRVYVHCWGGVGRTGTVIGAWLVRHGLDGDAALKEVQRLYDGSPKAKVKPVRSPETNEQRDYVRAWPAHEAKRKEALAAASVGAPTLQQRYRGALLGLAAGDALGTTLEFQGPGTFTPIATMVGGGPFRLEPGQWTDDTSMALCLAHSLVECGRFDAHDQMRRYVDWWKYGYMSSTGRCFDIGTTVHAALSRFIETGDPIAGPTGEHTAGNGSLMRLAPVVLFHAKMPRRAVALAAESSRTTHGTRAAVDACRYFAALLLAALRGVPKAEFLDPAYVDRLGFFHAEPLDPKVLTVARGSFREKEPPAIRGTGYVIDSLEAALWAFHRTDTFESGALAAVNLGDDADTTGAVYGQIAGAHYGVGGIPEGWVARLTMRAEIGALADQLLAGGGAR